MLNAPSYGSSSPISVETDSISNLDPEFLQQPPRRAQSPTTLEYGTPPSLCQWPQQESIPAEASSRSQQPKKRKRRVKHPDALDYEREDRPRDDLLKRKLRWLYLRQFNAEGLEKIISQVHGTTDDTSYTYSSNRTYILDACRGWKSKSLSKMLVSFIFIVHPLTYNSNLPFRSTCKMRKRSPGRNSHISGWRPRQIPSACTAIL